MKQRHDTSPRTTAVRLATAVDGSVELVHQLHEVHAQQWALEDAARYPDASTEHVAIAKVAIDACNGRRHRLIDAIDASVNYVPSQDIQRCYSETVGELCDRLLIFDLKVAALEMCSSRTQDQDSAAGAIWRVCDHLSIVVSQLLEDIAAGRAAMPPRAGIKIYGRVGSAYAGSQQDVAAVTASRE